ncbi:hypothetical protein LguiB_027267 [Lonicera macranthoides]
MDMRSLVRALVRSYLIGEVVGRENLRTKKVSGNKTNLMDIVIQDANHLSSSSVFTKADELSSDNVILKTINQLTENGELGTYWVLATVVAVETDKEWHDLSCRYNGCFKKASTRKRSNLKLKASTSKRSNLNLEKVGGWSQIYKGLSFVTIKEAGHKAPVG